VRTLMFLFASLLGVACAPAMQSIRVYSEPPGAQVLLKGRVEATTPAQIKVSRREADVAIRLEKEGYMPVDIALRRSLDPWFVPKSCGVGLLLGVALGTANGLTNGTLGTRGNLYATIAGGVAVGGAEFVGGFVTGAAYRFKPGEITVGLNKRQGE
jgi:hypothetical protein